MPDEIRLGKYAPFQQKTQPKFLWTIQTPGRHCRVMLTSGAELVANLDNASANCIADFIVSHELNVA